MKKGISFFIVSVLIFTAVNVAGFSQKESTIFRVSFPNLSINEKDEEIFLDLEGSNHMLKKENHYIFPVYLKSFIFPLGTTIKEIIVNPSNINCVFLNKKLEVASGPVICGSNKISNKCDNVPISIYKWYDFDIGTGIYNGVRSVIVKILLYPVQYKPDKDLLEWAEDMEISINHRLAASKTSASSDDIFELLVLSPDNFENELDDLINHKFNNGILSKFVSLNDIYNGVFFPVQGRDNQEKIKYFIKNAVDNWQVKFVLLVGDNTYFPIRLSHIYMNDWDDNFIVSDLYYSDIYNDTLGFSSWDTNGNDIFGDLNVPGVEDDEVDLYPDVYLGRLACSDNFEVSTCVQKIIGYETNKAYTEHWFTEIIGVGGDTHVGESEEIDEGEYVNEFIINDLNLFVPTKLYASLGKLSGYLPTGSARITNNINDGCGFLNFIGHGATWGYGTHPHGDSSTWLPTPNNYYFSTDVLNLINSNKLPIVLNSGCDVGKFHEDKDCFPWAFVKNPDGGGIASCGASAVSYGGSGSDSTEVWVGKMIVGMYNSYNQKATTGSATTFGEIWSEAITNYLVPGMTAIDYKVVESWEPFGDPSLVIAEQSQLPEKPEPPKGRISGKINVEYTYNASTADPDGDNLYYLFNWGDNSYSAWVGPFESGKEATASHAWTKKGSYEIRVKAKDIHGVQGEWSEPLSTSIQKSKVKNYSILYYLFRNQQNFFPILKLIMKII